MKIEFVKDNSPEDPSMNGVVYFTRVDGVPLKGSAYGRTEYYAREHFNRFVNECKGKEYEVIETVIIEDK